MSRASYVRTMRVILDEFLAWKLDRLLSFSTLSSDASAETAVQLTGWHVLKRVIIRAANDTGRRETVGIVTETLFLQ